MQESAPAPSELRSSPVLPATSSWSTRARPMPPVAPAMKSRIDDFACVAMFTAMQDADPAERRPAAAYAPSMGARLPSDAGLRPVELRVLAKPALAVAEPAIVVHQFDRAQILDHLEP